MIYERCYNLLLLTLTDTIHNSFIVNVTYNNMYVGFRAMFFFLNTDMGKYFKTSLYFKYILLFVYYYITIYKHRSHDFGDKKQSAQDM